MVIPAQNQENFKAILNTMVVGKTIKSVDSECINVLHIEFTDGTSISLWSEPAPNGIPSFSLEK